MSVCSFNHCIKTARWFGYKYNVPCAWIGRADSITSPLALGLYFITIFVFYYYICVCVLLFVFYYYIYVLLFVFNYYILLYFITIYHCILLLYITTFAQTPYFERENRNPFCILGRSNASYIVLTHTFARQKQTRRITYANIWMSKANDLALTHTFARQKQTS